MVTFYTANEAQAQSIPGIDYHNNSLEKFFFWYVSEN